MAGSIRLDDPMYLSRGLFGRERAKMKVNDAANLYLAQWEEQVVEAAAPAKKARASGGSSVRADRRPEEPLVHAWHTHGIDVDQPKVNKEQQAAG